MILQIIQTKELCKEKLIEIVERKGIGHPDTLCDLIAENFSRIYSKYCLKHCGVILNHWVDKITISGSVAKLDFGKAKIIKPMSIYLFGRVTKEMGEIKIPIGRIFRQSAEDIFTKIFKNQPILQYVKYKIDINQTLGKDHAREFYFPENKERLISLPERYRANDTVATVGYAPLTFAERLAILIENHINSSKFKSIFPETGWDVKVMISKVRKNFDITVAIPFLARLIPSYKVYSYKKHLIKKYLKKWLQIIFAQENSGYKFTLSINTKDRGKFAYLTVFGTAADKGDYGVVGRGNKYNSIISLFRPSPAEAFAGKNPVNHVGKIYSAIAHDIAQYLNRTLVKGVEIIMTTKNGLNLDSPSLIVVKYGQKRKGIINIERKITKVIRSFFKKLPEYSLKIINEHPIDRHRNCKTLMEINL